MLAEIKLTVTENSKVIETVTKQTETQPPQLLKSIEEFQHLSNKVMTSLIENSGQPGDGDLDLGDEEADEDDVDDDAEGTPRKKKK